MASLVLHEISAKGLAQFAAKPSHALLLAGPAGIGKGSIALDLANKFLASTNSTSSPYLRIVHPGKEKSISIDVVRELEHFLSLRVPGNGKRLIIIEDAHLLTLEAQNALLKMLEEPPQDTVLVLTAANEQALLPTIRSRLTKVSIKRPPADKLIDHFKHAGYQVAEIHQAQLMSGGLPGLMQTLLEKNTEHPLAIAATMARQIAQKSSFERLALVDALAKDRDNCLNVLNILQQMAHLSLSGSKPSKSWQRILAESYRAHELLLSSVQPKLVLTNLMLNL